MRAPLLCQVLTLVASCCGSAYAQDTIQVFQYNGGPQPPEITVFSDIDSTGDIEFGVPLSRLFDANSPLRGSLADSLEFPGPDDTTDTGILIKMDNWGAGTRRAIICVQATQTIETVTEICETITVTIVRGGSFEISDEAKEVLTQGGRWAWFYEVLRLQKLLAIEEAIDPMSREAVRLRQRLDKISNKNAAYKTLVDGTHYMVLTREVVKEIKIEERTSETVEVTLYIVWRGDAFDTHGVFVPEIEISLIQEPVTGTPPPAEMNIDDDALIVGFIDIVEANVPVTEIAYDCDSLQNVPILQVNPDVGFILQNKCQAETLHASIDGYADVSLPPAPAPDDWWETAYGYLPFAQAVTLNWNSSGEDAGSSLILTAPPDAIEALSSISAEGASGQIVVSWLLESYDGIYAFNVLRADNVEGPYSKLTATEIPNDARYYPYRFHYTDSDLVAGLEYYYQVEAIANDERALFGPVTATAALPRSTVVLHRNIPNPFNPTSKIRYELPGSGLDRVLLQILDPAGRLVRTLIDQREGPGGHTAIWDGTDSDGRDVASGIYFYRLRTTDSSIVRKMALIR